MRGAMGRGRLQLSGQPNTTAEPAGRGDSGR